MASLRLVLCWLAVVSLAWLAAGQHLVPMGLTVQLDDTYYFMSPFSAGTVAVSRPAALADVPAVHGFRPVTVVNEPGITRAALPRLLANWTAIDDVFSMGFARGVFLAGARDTSTVASPRRRAGRRYASRECRNGGRRQQRRPVGPLLPRDGLGCAACRLPAVLRLCRRLHPGTATEAPTAASRRCRHRCRRRRR